MIPDPTDRADSPLVAGGPGHPAGEQPPAEPRPGQTCWLCGDPVTDPPRIIGHWSATQSRIAHRHCLRILGELDLNLPFPPGPRR